jgi:hypothetical protein
MPFADRLRRVIGSTTLEPGELPPSAILVLRRLEDPLPRSLPLGGEEISAPVAWEGAVCSAVRQNLSRAVRPADQPVGPGDNAVLFADVAEMLACLALDLRDGSAPLRWWWRTILRGTAYPMVPARIGDALAGAWVQQPAFLPAVLDRLAQRRQIPAVLPLLSSAQARTLLVLMARSFDVADAIAIPEFRPPLDRTEALRPPAVSPELHREARQQSAAPQPLVQGPDHLDEPLPWTKFLAPGTVPASLPREHQALLGLALMLRRAYPAVRAVSFRARFRQWFAAASPPPAVSESVVFEEPEVREPMRTAAVEAPFVLKHRIDETAPEQSTLEPAAPEQPTLEPATLEPPGPNRVPEPQPAPPRADEALHVVAQLPATAQEGADTELGGVFFLINLMRALDLFECFEVPLGGWAFLELIARCLIPAEALCDPIWPVLASLDGRGPHQGIAAGFEGLPAYEVPRRWTAMLDPAGLPRIRFRGNRFQLWHDRGFPLLDSGELSQLSADRRALRRYPARRPSAHALGCSVEAPLQRFLGFAVPYVRWRLKYSLGVNETPLFRRARIYATATHVDVAMPLDSITVPVRRNGLDVNPGWVPALGRVIAFHFV